MALEILNDIHDNLEDLTGQISSLKDKVPKVNAFLKYAEAKNAEQKKNPRVFTLKNDEVEERVTELALALRDYYAPGESLLKRAEAAAKVVGGDVAQKFAMARATKKGLTELVRELLPGQDIGIPSAVVEFVDHAIKVLEDGKVSVYACKRPVTDLGVGFDQLAGLNAEKSQFRLGYIYPLKYKGLFSGGISRGVLLFGPPGTGKTLLAKAATAEIKNSAFFTATPGEIKGKYVGETEKNIRSLFVCAGEYLNRKPDRYKLAVIFMDEFDGLAADRDSGPNAGDSVNEFLQNMDGLKSNAKVSVLAATNYPWNLDDAILRRFDTRIFVDLPDRLARTSIIYSELCRAYMVPESNPKDARVFVRGMDEDGNIVWSSAVDNLFGTDDKEGILKKYGGELIVLETPATGGGLFSRKAQTPAVTRQEIKQTLTREDVEWLAGYTGPNVTSKSLMGRESEAEYEDSTAHPYGYSASDISKLVRKAIALASERVVGLRDEKNLYPVHFVEPASNSSVTYWIFDPTGIRGATVSIADLEKLDEEESRTLTEADKKNFQRRVDRVVAFNITRADLEKAQRMFSSTIDPDKYKQMKEWVKKNASS